ncbi:hypothetical protein AYI70_g4402 [Smittium culicis]|uniref:Uncharacterized protein n=1 Tax=Smittium culicis TaxID=133412 RepID=A0A1R1XZ55_9FUNG|nr:hypothetical protein AYI70_g4402 [Smittium culicis]
MAKIAHLEAFTVIYKEFEHSLMTSNDICKISPVSPRTAALSAKSSTSVRMDISDTPAPNRIIVPIIDHSKWFSCYINEPQLVGQFHMG